MTKQSNPRGDNATTTQSSRPGSTPVVKPEPPNGYPKRIQCRIMGGPEAKDVFAFFPTAVMSNGCHAFYQGLDVEYLGERDNYRVCIKILKHRSDGNIFNIGGYIYFRLPGERNRQIRRFTGQYSTKSKTGSLYIYTAPSKLPSTIGLH